MVTHKYIYAQQHARVYYVGIHAIVSRKTLSVYTPHTVPAIPAYKMRMVSVGLPMSRDDHCCKVHRDVYLFSFLRTSVMRTI